MVAKAYTDENPHNFYVSPTSVRNSFIPTFFVGFIEIRKAYLPYITNIAQPVVPKLTITQRGVISLSKVAAVQILWRKSNRPLKGQLWPRTR